MKRWSLIVVCLLACWATAVRCDTESSSDEVEVAVEGEDEVVENTDTEAGGSDDEEGAEPDYPKPPPEIEYEILQESDKCRTRVTNDDFVGLHFVGKLSSDGSVFYDSEEDNEKDEWISFPMGVGESIKGLELGLLGMCRDEIRKIVVEPEMIKNGRHVFDPTDGKIPRDQKLVFEVQLMAMGPNYNKGLPNMFKVYDTDKDEILTQEEIAAYMVSEGTFPAGELVDRLAKEVIEKDDRDKDGFIQWTEFSGPKHDEL